MKNADESLREVTIAGTMDELLKDTIKDYKKESLFKTKLVALLVFIIFILFIGFGVYNYLITKAHNNMLERVNTENHQRYKDFVELFEFEGIEQNGEIGNNGNIDQNIEKK